MIGARGGCARKYVWSPCGAECVESIESCRRLGEALAQQERVRMFEPPVSLPLFAVKQHWHERFHADAGNAWLRRTLAELLGR